MSQVSNVITFPEPEELPEEIREPMDEIMLWACIVSSHISGAGAAALLRVLADKLETMDL